VAAASAEGRFGVIARIKVINNRLKIFRGLGSFTVGQRYMSLRDGMTVFWRFWGGGDSALALSKILLRDSPNNHRLGRTIRLDSHELARSPDPRAQV
jgi:hypothetical protein